MRKIFLLVVIFTAVYQDSFAFIDNFGIYVGGNYFFKEQELEYVGYAQDYSTGKLFFDHDGFSAQTGLTISLTPKIRFIFDYRFPRDSDYSYYYAQPPVVYGPNSYWLKTSVSDYSLGVQYFLIKKSVGFFAGGKFNHTIIDASYRYGYVHSRTGEIQAIFPPDHYTDLGRMEIDAFSLSLGVEKNLCSHLSLMFMLERYFGAFDQWEGTISPETANTQRLDGFYFMINLIGWIKNKNDR